MSLELLSIREAIEELVQKDKGSAEPKHCGEVVAESDSDNGRELFADIVVEKAVAGDDARVDGADENEDDAARGKDQNAYGYRCDDAHFESDSCSSWGLIYSCS